MTSIAKIELPTELLDAIQSTLPSDQVIRYEAPVFTVQRGTEPKLDFLGNIVGELEVAHVDASFHIAVTDSLLALRQFRWQWDLTDQQIQEKQALESEVFKRWPMKGERVYSDGQVMAELISKYGAIPWKWLPEFAWMSEVELANITLLNFAEDFSAPFVKQHFANVQHQIDRICFFRWFKDREYTFNSFSGTLHDIYLHIREIQLDDLRVAQSTSRITKCTSCGSTELTVQGMYTVCDYCQSKFGR